MSDEEVVTMGLRTIGTIRDVGWQWEAWAEPSREGLGRFNSYAAAARAIYEHDVGQRDGGGK